MTDLHDSPLPRLRPSEAEQAERDADNWLIKATETAAAGNPGTATLNALIALGYGVRGVSARLAGSDIADAVSDVVTAVDGLTETAGRVMVTQDLDGLTGLTAMLAARRPFWRRKGYMPAVVLPDIPEGTGS